jgi:hypothetical protein
MIYSGKGKLRGKWGHKELLLTTDQSRLKAFGDQ